MDFTVHKNDVTIIQLCLYNIPLIFYFVHLLIKYAKCNIAQYVIFLFTVGIFSDLGRILPLGNSGIHIYYVISMIWGIHLLHKYGIDKNRSNISLLRSFALYICYFIFISIIIHHDNIFLVTSQSFRYIIPVLVYFIVDSFIKQTNGRGVIIFHRVIRDLIMSQIIFCIIKLIVLRATQEGLVGSLSGLEGGGAGTSFPMLALLWLAFVTKMKFSRKFWLYAVGLLFIGFMTGKRAIWILFPLEFVILFLYYRAKDVASLTKYITPAIIVGCLFLYLGLRLSPTLNPDKKVWGRFDIEYAYDYALKYSGGSEASEGGISINEGEGRFGALKLFINDILDIGNYNNIFLFGYGNEEIKYYDKTDYTNRDTNKGIDHRGSITEIVYMYFISGFIGVVLFLCYFLRMLFMITRDKFIWIVILVVFYDLFLYNGMIVHNVPMQSLLYIFALTTSIAVKYKQYKVE